MDGSCVWSEEEVSKGNSILPFSGMEIPIFKFLSKSPIKFFIKPEQLIDETKLLRLEVCRPEQVQSN